MKDRRHRESSRRSGTRRFPFRAAKSKRPAANFESRQNFDHYLYSNDYPL
jgi:hypothetical protein